MGGSRGFRLRRLRQGAGLRQQRVALARPHSPSLEPEHPDRSGDRVRDAQAPERVHLLHQGWQGSSIRDFCAQKARTRISLPYVSRGDDPPEPPDVRRKAPHGQRGCGRSVYFVLPGSRADASERRVGSFLYPTGDPGAQKRVPGSPRFALRGTTPRCEAPDILEQRPGLGLAARQQDNDRGIQAPAPECRGRQPAASNVTS